MHRYNFQFFLMMPSFLELFQKVQSPEYINVDHIRSTITECVLFATQKAATKHEYHPQD